MSTVKVIDVVSIRGSQIYESEQQGSTKEAVKTSAGSVFRAVLDNRANDVDRVSQKLYDVALAGVTVGTTDPEAVLTAPAGAMVCIEDEEGIAFGTAISVACVKEAGTGGTSNPTKAANTKLLI